MTLTAPATDVFCLGGAGIMVVPGAVASATTNTCAFVNTSATALAAGTAIGTLGFTVPPTPARTEVALTEAQCTPAGAANFGTTQCGSTNDQGTGASTLAPTGPGSVTGSLPAITSITPRSGPPAGGTTVTISGAGFGTDSGATIVNFGPTQATNVVCSSTTQCTATSPAGSGTVDVFVSINGFQSPLAAADQFTYFPVPPPAPAAPDPCPTGIFNVSANVCINPSTVIPLSAGGFGFGSLQLTVTPGSNVAHWTITVSFNPSQLRVVACVVTLGTCDTTSATGEFVVSGMATSPLTGTVVLAQFTVQELTPSGSAATRRAFPADEFDIVCSITARLTDSDGNPVSTLGGGGRVVVAAAGDVNGDGAINAVDALCILRTVAALFATTNCPAVTTTIPSPAEVNGDRVVSVLDALCVLRSVAGLPPTRACPNALSVH
ncbi:MAG: IPT/TIG domain-containing protein [Dehalococcoidia bacterium]